MHPAEGHPHVRPQRLGRLQALGQDRPQPASAPSGAPFCADPVQARGDRGQPVLQLQPRGLQRRPAVVGQRRADRRAVAPDHLGLGILAGPRPSARSAGCRGPSSSAGPWRGGRPRRPAWPPRGGSGTGRVGGARRRGPSSTALRIESWPSETTPAIGTGNAAFTSPISSARSSWRRGQEAPGQQDLAAEARRAAPRGPRGRRRAAGRRWPGSPARPRR